MQLNLLNPTVILAASPVLLIFKIRVPDRDSTVEDITFTLPCAALLGHVFKVFQDATLQVVDLAKAFLQHKG